MQRPRGFFPDLAYLLSLPERSVRALLGWIARLFLMLSALLPKPLRESRFFKVAVRKQLRILSEKIGGAEAPANDRNAQAQSESIGSAIVGGAVDNALVFGLHVSPVWVLLALADTVDGARGIVREIVSELEHEGVLPKDSRATKLDEVLAQVSKISGTVAESIDAPPLSLAEMRRTVLAMRDEARRIDLESILSARDLEQLWTAVQSQSKQDDRSIFEVSSGIALSTLTSVGAFSALVGRSALATARAGGQLFWRELIASYISSAEEMQRRGFFATLHRGLRPQTRGTLRSFDPRRISITEHLCSAGRWWHAPWSKSKRSAIAIET